MNRINRLEGKENPRFDTDTGRPFVMDGDRIELTFTRVYLDSDETEHIGDVSAMFRSMERSRLRTREELEEYLKELEG